MACLARSFACCASLSDSLSGGCHPCAWILDSLTNDQENMLGPVTHEKEHESNMTLLGAGEINRTAYELPLYSKPVSKGIRGMKMLVEVNEQRT